MYANINGWRFNEHKQYTFMRKYKNEILFFIINFDSQLVDVAINVPSHAFDFLQIPQMESYQATDLMTGAKEEISLLPYKPTDVSVGGYKRKDFKDYFLNKKTKICILFIPRSLMNDRGLFYAHHSNKYSQRLFR